MITGNTQLNIQNIYLIGHTYTISQLLISILKPMLKRIFTILIQYIRLVYLVDIFVVSVYT